MKIRLVHCAVVVLLAMSTFATAAEANQGVYEYVIKKSDMDFETASQALAAQFDQAPFRLLAMLDMSAGDAFAGRRNENADK